MKKLWTALLAMTVLFGLLSAAAVADVMENIKIYDQQYYYPSGYLKGFTMSYTVGSDYEAADIRVSVQTQPFRKEVKGNTHGDFTDFGEYAINHGYKYKNWQDAQKPESCGFVAWASDTFSRPASGGKTTPITVRLPDKLIDCNNTQQYYMYVWANYHDMTYPDAYVTSFSTGNGQVVVNQDNSQVVADPNKPGNIPPSNSSSAAQDTPASVNMPRTGDDSLLILWLAISLLAGAGVLVLLRRRASDR